MACSWLMIHLHKCMHAQPHGLNIRPSSPNPHPSNLACHRSKDNSFGDKGSHEIHSTHEIPRSLMSFELQYNNVLSKRPVYTLLTPFPLEKNNPKTAREREMPEARERGIKRKKAQNIIPILPSVKVTAACLPWFRDLTSWQ